jgi:branched-chain amino acid transport system substrate-binding protein
MYPDTAMRVPGNVFYNGYWATRALLEAVERAGTTNNHAVIKELEQLKMSAEDRMQHHDAYMNPVTHQVQQTIYLATANLESEDENNLFQTLSNTSPEEVADSAAESACVLESFEHTPVYEP